LLRFFGLNAKLSYNLRTPVCLVNNTKINN
jgi:hypothetical protein